MVSQPGVELVDFWHFFRFGGFPTAVPALDLALDEPFRFAEVFQSQRFVIDSMEVGQGIHQRLAHLTGRIGERLELRGDLVADDDSLKTFHNKKRRADHRLVIAE